MRALAGVCLIAAVLVFLGATTAHTAVIRVTGYLLVIGLCLTGLQIALATATATP